MLIKAIIVDDELGNIETLRAMIEKYCKNVLICGTAQTNAQATSLILQHNPNLVFLDIQLQNETTFQLLKSLDTIDFEIVFVTAYNQFAINAIKFAAIDYLLKPINIDELKLAVAKVAANIEKKDSVTKIQHLLSNINPASSNLKKLGIITLSGILFKEIDSIVKLKAEGNYTRIYFNDNSNEVSSKSLREYESLLPDNLFCRIHNTHIINLNYIKKYQKGRGGYVIMEDDTEIDVSQRKKIEFLQKIGNV